MSSLPTLPTTTWGTESDANRIKKTYVKGYMDVSGGELSVHNTAFNVFNSEGKGSFRMDPQKMTVKDSTGQEVDISLSYLTFLNVLVPPDGLPVSIPDKVKYIFTVGKETNIGKSDASSNFRVYGNTYVEENLFVNMDASFGQRFLLMGDASLNSNLYVKLNTRMDGDLSLNNRLFVSKDVSLNSNLYVKSNTQMDGDLSLNNRLFVSKDVSLNSNLYVKLNTRMDGDLSLNNRLFVSKDVSLNSNLYVKSNTQMDGDLSLNNRLFVSKDVSLNSNLYVKLNTQMDGDLSLNNRLFVSKDVSLNSNLYVKSNTWIDGDLSLNNRLFVSKDVSLNSNLYVKSNTWIDGDLSLNNRLFVSKDVSLNSNLYVKSNTWIDGDLSLNNRLFVSKDVSLNSNLYVKSNTQMDGDLSLNNRLFVSKDVSMNSNLYVKSNTWIDGDLSLNNRLFVSKDASMNGNLYVRGRTTFYEPSGSVITDGTSRGTLNLTHGDASGGSSILFQSVNSANNDYAYIQYQENVPYAGQTSTEAGLLSIGIENEITSTHRDRIALISANGSGNVGINTKFPNYNLDVSGQMRICEGTGTIASATTGSMILEHTAVGGTSSIMFKGPNSTTNDYAYIQYEDNTTYTLPVLKYDFAMDVTSILTTTGVPSTGSNTASINSSGSISSVVVSGLSPPNKFPSDISCLYFYQTNILSGNINNISFIQTQPGQVNPFNAGGFTFSAWIRPITTGATNCRFYILDISPGTNTSNFSIHFGGGEIAALIGDDSTNFIATAGNLLTPNTWVHYAFTFDNATSTGRHYINGNLNGGTKYGTGYSGKQLTATSQKILMGCKSGYTNGGLIVGTIVDAKGFNGYMNYVNMFDRALSITDIAVLYNTPGYTQSTINRGLMTFGIENEPGAVFNDRIALMPANGSGFVGINTKTPAHTLSLGQLNADCKLALYDDGTGSNWYGIGANNYNLTFGAAVGTANQNEPQMKLSNTGSLDIKNSLSIGKNNTITISPATNPKIEFGNGSGISRWKIEDVVLNRDGGAGPNFDYGAQSKLIFSAKSNSAFNGYPQDIAYIDGMTLVPNSQGNGVLSTGINVGIGTTNPTYNLDVSGTIQVKSGTSEANPSLTIIKDTGMASAWFESPGWQHKGQLEVKESNGNSMSFTMSTDGVGIIHAKKIGIGYNNVCINPQTLGNVGIGTLAPAFKLDVNGSLRAGATTITGATTISTFTTGIVHSAANGSLTSSLILAADITDGAVTTGKIADGAVTTGKIATGAVTSTAVGLGNVTNESKATMFTSPSFTGTALFAGAVGINGKTPANGYELDVTGDIRASASIAADNFNATSDYRIKTDVKVLDASFNVDVLKPVTYTNTRHGRQDVGFIAHEVQEHYPFLVNGEKDGENMQSLNYIGLIGILTKEIQDLKRRLAETEAKVASVETDVRTIETKVEEVDDIIISVEDTVLSVKNAVSSVENKVSSFDDKVSSVENTVLLEQARLTICETSIALNKSAIKDLDERLQS